MRPLSRLFATLLTGSLAATLNADGLQVADVFTDHAVLQQGVDLPIWGKGEPGAKVVVEFAGQSKSTHAGDDGTWRVLLMPLKAHATGNRMIVRSGEHQKEFRNLLVGEVWYASGQSNMQMNVGSCARKIPEIQDIAQGPTTNGIRFLRVNEPDSPHVLTHREQSAPWQIDSPINRSKQSAVAYFFARRLHQALDVPIGIIEGSWGGKPIEGFIPKPYFKKDEVLRPIVSLAEQNKLTELAAIEGGVIIRNTAGMPGRIFNARVAPIAPYSIRGFIWYQGESNAGRGEDPRNYQIKMAALANGWRDTWGQANLPLYFVQLPGFRDTATGWVRLREEQRLSLAIPHTGMAVAIDLRDADIHPANKLDVGNRLARWALAKTYDQEIPFSGPLFKNATVEGDSMRVEFDHADDGLMIARKEGLSPPVPMSSADSKLAHFELADESGQWYAAQATIDGSTVLVNSPAVKKPRAVRYACSGAPINANLYNRAGLPASPFCSELHLLPWEHTK